MTAHRTLRLLLRILGVVMLLAIVAVFLPRGALSACHAWLGLGELPEGPIVEYLARSVSAFYAGLGGLLLLVASNLRRYSAVIIYLAIAFMVFGVAILVIDVQLALPAWWAAFEGPFVIAVGAVLLLLNTKARWRYPL